MLRSVVSTRSRRRRPGRHRSVASARPVILVAGASVVQRLVQASLRDAGFRVDTVSQRQLIPALAVDLEPDVVVLDTESVEAADRDLRRLAEVRRIPVMVTCASPAAVSPGAVLDAGAADVMAMPLDPAELAARIRNLVRRQGRALATGRVRIGGVIVDLDGRTVHAGTRTRTIGRTDWRLLVRLLGASGRAVPQDELLIAAFGPEAVGDLAALRGAMARLRWKLRATDGSDPIVVARGLGYALRT